MTEEQLSNILKFMTTVDCSDEVRKGMLEMAATTLTADRLKDLVSDNVNTTAEANNQNAEIFKFTKQEILKMPNLSERISEQQVASLTFRDAKAAKTVGTI